MAQPVHISDVVRKIMQMLERKRELEKPLASKATGQGGCLSQSPAGTKKAEIGSLNGKCTR